MIKKKYKKINPKKQINLKQWKEGQVEGDYP